MGQKTDTDYGEKMKVRKIERPSAEEMMIRIATEADAGGLLEIYAPYVRDTAITFEYEVPSVEEFVSRIREVQERYPYLVAERAGRIVGYAYAGPFHSRAAYQWGVETSIYVDKSCKRTGVGGKLHEALENILREQGILNLNACIAYPRPVDEYLTEDSVKFHERLGYRLVGEFEKCGYKFSKWYNMVWMEKHIGVHLEKQPPVKNFEQVREIVKERYRIS